MLTPSFITVVTGQIHIDPRIKIVPSFGVVWACLMEFVSESYLIYALSSEGVSTGTYMRKKRLAN